MARHLAKEIKRKQKKKRLLADGDRRPNEEGRIRLFRTRQVTWKKYLRTLRDGERKEGLEKGRLSNVGNWGSSVSVGHGGNGIKEEGLPLV